MSPIRPTPGTAHSIAPGDYTVATSRTTAARHTTSSPPAAFLYGNDFPKKLQADLQKAATRLNLTPLDIVMQSYEPIQTVNLCIHPLQGSPRFFWGAGKLLPTSQVHETENGTYIAKWHLEEVKPYSPHAEWSLDKPVAWPLSELLMRLETSSRSTGYPTGAPTGSGELSRNARFMVDSDMFQPRPLNLTAAAVSPSVRQTQRTTTQSPQSPRNWGSSDRPVSPTTAEIPTQFQGGKRRVSSTDSSEIGPPVKRYTSTDNRIGLSTASSNSTSLPLITKWTEIKPWLDRYEPAQLHGYRGFEPGHIEALVDYFSPGSAVKFKSFFAVKEPFQMYIFNANPINKNRSHAPKSIIETMLRERQDVLKAPFKYHEDVRDEIWRNPSQTALANQIASAQRSVNPGSGLTIFRPIPSTLSPVEYVHQFFTNLQPRTP